MFPFIIRYRRHSSAQFARLRIMQKPLVQCLRQLKQCARILDQSNKLSNDLNQLQSLFADIAQEVHHIRIAPDYDIIGPPPFDGYTYIWTWKSIVIRFCGSNFTFVLSLTSLVTYLQLVLSMHSLFVSQAYSSFILFLLLLFHHFPVVLLNHY